MYPPPQGGGLIEAARGSGVRARRSSIRLLREAASLKRRGSSSRLPSARGIRLLREAASLKPPGRVAAQRTSGLYPPPQGGGLIEASSARSRARAAGSVSASSGRRPH